MWPNRADAQGIITVWSRPFPWEGHVRLQSCNGKGFEPTPAGGIVDQEALKKQAGEAAAAMVESGMVVGLGTGSTVKYTILELARRVREDGLDILGIPTSEASAALAKEGGITLTDLDQHPEVDITIDGADEFDGDLQLIKGGGGALTREKIVAYASKRMVVVADESKQVTQLGTTFALPVEVIALGKTPVQQFLESLGATVVLRQAQGKLYRSDNGNPILDATFPGIKNPIEVQLALDQFPGVVCCGLFLGLCDTVVMAASSGIETLKKF